MSNIKLLPHQIEAFEATKDHNKVAYYLDMGLGKTFLGSYKAASLGGQILTVCQKSKVEDWVEHFKEFHPELSVSDLTSRKPDYTSDVLVINYDIVWRRKRLYDLNNLTLILDESSYIKNDKRKRSHCFVKCDSSQIEPIYFKNLILLSGTPTGGKYEELITQANILDWEISKFDYYENYIDYIEISIDSKHPGIKMDIPKIIGYKNVNILKENFKKHGAVFMKTEEVLELPEQTHIDIKVKKPTEYNKFLKDRVIEIEEKELLGDTVLVELMYARQIASLYNKHKWKALEDLMEFTEDRLIIFYNWNDEYLKIKKLCDKLKKPLSVMNGDRRNLDKYKYCENSVTAIQYQAGAMGLNLQLSNKIVYFSLPLSGELFEQSKKRTHRIGQERPCFYYYMLSNNTIEHEIMETLKNKEDYNAELFRG